MDDLKKQEKTGNLPYQKGMKITDTMITDLYNDPRIGFGSVDKYYKKLKSIDPTVKLATVKKVIGEHETYQQFQPNNKANLYGSVVADYPGDMYEMDIIVYDRFEITQYKYILVVIDVYSRYMQCRPMTNRRLETTIKNLGDIFDIMMVPRKIKCDNEFNKKEYIDYCKTLDIQTIFTDPYELHKNPIVERSNRTLARILQLIRRTTKNYHWEQYLEDAETNYNTTIHRTTGHTPMSIWDGDEFNDQTTTHVIQSYKVGDRVRIAYKRQLFEKGDSQTHSDKAYHITEVLRQRYKIDDGTDLLYKAYELKKVADIVYPSDIVPVKLPIYRINRPVITDRRITRSQTNK